MNKNQTQDDAALTHAAKKVNNNGEHEVIWKQLKVHASYPPSAASSAFSFRSLFRIVRKVADDFWSVTLPEGSRGGELAPVCY